MTIKLKGNRVAIEKNKAKGPGQFGGLIMPDSEEFTGTIVYVGETADASLKVGQKVYFGTNYQQCMINGKNLCILSDSEIFATVE